jgi:hypothetical protein
MALLHSAFALWEHLHVSVHTVTVAEREAWLGLPASFTAHICPPPCRGPYVALAVPAVMSYCMEGWAVEVLIFLSGMLKNADVAVGVTGLSLQFSTFVWLAAASIGSATSTRVANKVRSLSVVTVPVYHLQG